MLINLKTVHKPATLGEAILRLSEPGTFPLYHGAALQRARRSDVGAAVDLSRLELDYVQDSDNRLRLGTMLTLEQVRQACADRSDWPKLGALAEALAEEMPLTLRNTMGLGDLLMERNPQSPTLTTLLALGGVLKRIDVTMHFTVAAWLAIEEDVSRYLLAHVLVPRQPQRAAVAYEKVSRTPRDLPIVAAVACVEAHEMGHHSRLALCGVARHPVLQPEAAQVFDQTGDIDAALEELQIDPPGDHWGSAEYRAEMARVMSRRALLRAVEQYNQAPDTASENESE
jgi:carbon-monoxide dehydrogenase medium subunit